MTLIIFLLLLFTACEIGQKAAVSASSAVRYSGWVLVAVAAIVFVLLLFGTYEMRVGERHGSPPRALPSTVGSSGPTFKLNSLSSPP